MLIDYDIASKTYDNSRSASEKLVMRLIARARQEPAVNDQAFISLVEQKNYSMFRQLAEREYQDGLERLRADVGKVFLPEGAGETLIWMKAAHPEQAVGIDRRTDGWE